MRTQRLAFSQLYEEMEVLEKETLGTIKGGNDEYITYEFGINGYGQRFMREYGSSEWISLLDEVQIPYPGPGGGGGPDYSYITVVPGTNPFGFGDGNNPGGGGGTGSNGNTGGFDTIALSLQLITHLNSQFSTFMTNNSNVIASAETPPGYTLNPDGSFTETATGNIVYGTARKSGDLVLVNISPNILINGSNNGLIGHELIHALHLNQNSSLYNTNRAQFNLESEYAAYSYQWYYASMTGDYVTAGFCSDEMSRLMYQGATGMFSNNLGPN